MDESEEGALREVFLSVKPYLAFPSDLEEAIDGVSESSSNLEEFEKGFEELILEQEDPSKKTDFRIFLNKLQGR